MENSADPLQKKDGLLARNTIINLLGQGVPLLFAVIAIPFVIDGLGTERFGVLTIVWIVIGYFGLFDMGLGKATTKFVADYDAKGGKDLAPIIITSLLLLVALGIIGSLVIVLITPMLVHNVLNIPSELIGETESAFYILSASIPFVLGSISARGVLEAQQRFPIVNAIKIPASIINYVGPLLVLIFSNQLHHVVALLVIARVITFFIYLIYSFQGTNVAGLSNYPIVKWAKELLGFGAWLTVSNFISPIMVYMDRFILGAILTMSAVAYYTTPYEVISRLLIVPGAFMGVMFPAFSVLSISDKEKLTQLYQSSIRYLVLAIMPVVVLLILSADSLLYLWIGEEFAENSTVVMQILAVGIFANSLAMVPSTAIQAVGRPDIRAKIHMVELPVYLAMIWFFTQAWGIEGVALAWTLRVTMDGLMILYFFNRIVPVIKKQWRNAVINVLLYGSIFVLMGIMYQFTEKIFVKCLLAAISSAVTFCMLWVLTMKNDEKERLFKLLHDVKNIIKSRDYSASRM